MERERREAILREIQRVMDDVIAELDLDLPEGYKLVYETREINPVYFPS